MMTQHIQAQTFHARRGTTKNTFQYGVDFVLCDLEADTQPFLMSRNRFNLWSLWDHRYGGKRVSGSGTEWFREVLISQEFPIDGARLVLLTQPSFLWLHFNPVSFWIALCDDLPCAVVAEVNNTFGDRHCYFCAADDFAPLTKDMTIEAQKLLHVSPFQEVAGVYQFNFNITKSEIDIRISFENEGQGVLATLKGDCHPATNRSLLWAALRRPLGAARVVALIHWQAVILFFKRAPFRTRPEPPEQLVSNTKDPKR